MDTVQKTIFYLFILGLALIGVGYYTGSTALIKQFFDSANSLDLTATGRKSDGTFANYPSGG